MSQSSTGIQMPTRSAQTARKSYARTPTILDLPRLTEVQLRSFEWFKGEGLSELFSEISPIVSFNKNLELHFGDFYFGEVLRLARDLRGARNCRERLAYLFDSAGAGNWMGRHFFSGGMMPSRDLLPLAAAPLVLEQQWSWNGTHYGRTAGAWLAQLDARAGEALDVLAQAYGAAAAPRWLGRWRIFLMACEELFTYSDGMEWGVAHYRWKNSDRAVDAWS